MIEQNMLGLLPVFKCEHFHPRGDIVFVHGLAGHPWGTWHPQSKTDNKSVDFWPFWLSEELQANGIDVNIWTFGYICPGMSLFDQASNLLEYLEVKDIGDHPFIFVAHSIGGLVVKEVIRTAKNYYNNYQVIIEQLQGIIFLSTPHQGSHLANLIDNINVLTKATANVQELKAHTPQLRVLNEWYRQNVNNLKIKTKVFYETQPINGVLVVDEDSANPGIKDVKPVAIPANHNSITKPEKNDLVYLSVIKICKKVFSKMPLVDKNRVNEVINTKSFKQNSAKESTEALEKIWNEIPNEVSQQIERELRFDLDKGRITWPDVEWKESKNFFLKEFWFVDQEDALPGAFLPPGTKLTFQGQSITPLIPLNPILFNYFTPKDLITKIQLAQMNSSDGPQVRITLDLPLSNMKNDSQQLKTYQIYKDYPIKEKNALPEVPVLEVWPNFRAEGWRSYSAFYYDAEFGEDTFQVYLPEAEERHPFVDGRGAYQIARLEEFPSFIECQDSSRNCIGLILLKTPEKIRLKDRWKVGVDFGTSFTNVYVNNNSTVEPLSMKNLHLKVTEVLTETRRPVLFEYFIPESFIPVDKPLPLESVLTTRGKPESDKNLERPIIDGRIYVPDRSRFEPSPSWIETNLHWRNYTANKLFLKNLALYASTIAAQEGVIEIQWCISYPTTFSRRDQNRYAKTWQDLTEELQAQTGIKHICPVPDDVGFFKTESLAFAQYFADMEGFDLVRTTCLYMRRETSDISVWYNNKLIHQCSVLFAGHHLLSDFLELNPNFLSQLSEQNLTDWDRLTKDKFRAKLDIFLRLESENWLKNKRDFAQDDPKFQGLLRLMAIGMGGLYYYVGIILGVLEQEGKYQSREITPVYIGGNGSQLLNWLAEGGSFLSSSEVSDLLSQMLIKGSGFYDHILEKTRLSQRPGDEVACGLVLGRTKLTGLGRKTKDPLIAGEDCEINGELIDWRERLEFEGNIRELEIPDLVQLKTFLDDFHGSLKELEIEEILPLQDYELGDEPGAEPEFAYNQTLWRNTQRELMNVLLNMRGETDDIPVEPPFIMGLKALLHVLAKEWAGKEDQ